MTMHARPHSQSTPTTKRRLLEDAHGTSTLSVRLNATLLLGRIICGVVAQQGGERVKILATELIATAAKTPAMQKLQLRLLVVLGLFNADASLGCWLLEEEETDAALRTLLASAAPDSLVVVAEVFNRASTSEAGRECLRPYVVDLTLLMKASGAPFEARVAAASAFTKLGLAAKALPSPSIELTDLLNIASEALFQANATTSPSLEGTRLGVNAVVEYAVEILSCLATRTALKREITFGSGRCKACLPLLFTLAQQQTGDDTKSSSSSSHNKVWYGLAFVFASLALSNDELRNEALREKDIAPEEFEQLQKIQEMQQQQQQQQVR